MKIFSKLRKNKAGVLGGLGDLAIGVVALAIVLTVGFLIVAQGQTQIASVQGFDQSNASVWTTAYNATVTTQGALADIPGWVPIIIIVGIGAALLGLVRLFNNK